MIFMRHTHSSALYSKACLKMPAGVNSGVRAFKEVDGSPFFVDSAKGAYLKDVDQNVYIDLVNAWGANLLGHAAPEITQAVQVALGKGSIFGTCHAGEIEFTELLNDFMPSLEKVRLANSGTEATMAAVRLARAYTGKKKMIKFEGCYHGTPDILLAEGEAQLPSKGIPSSSGVLEEIACEVLIAKYNDLEGVKHLFEQYPNDIAGIIIEPIAGNMNLIFPLPDFLSGLRQLCNQHEAVLIFDEVMVGFRVAAGGAQSLYQIQPDLTTLAKIIGGGFPLAAVGGKTAIMDYLAPKGPVGQGGTFSGHPISVAAGIATLKYLKMHPKTYEKLDQLTETLIEGLAQKANEHQIPFFAHSLGAIFGIFFTEEKEINDLEQVKRTNLNQFKAFFHGMLEQGIFFPPSVFEAAFTSLALTENDIEKIIKAADVVFKNIKSCN
jgi:glutamate-1-semialdehyde 2,1-aminomutase